MISNDEQVRDAIAEQASEWFASNDEAPLDPARSAGFVTWLQDSPTHVEEFLGVATVARDLQALGTSAEFSVEELLRRARTEGDSPGRSAWFSPPRAVGSQSTRHWRTAALIAASVAVVIVGLPHWFKLRPGNHELVTGTPPVLHLQTRHGEQRTFTLPDNSVLHLNTDSKATVRYDAAQRLVILDSGEAALEVIHGAAAPLQGSRRAGGSH